MTMCSVGGLLNIAYMKELPLSAAAARHKYHILMTKDQRQDEQRAQKRKGLMEEITKIKAPPKKTNGGGYEGPPEVC